MNSSLVAYYHTGNNMTVHTLTRNAGESDASLRGRFDKFKHDMESRRKLKFFLNMLDVGHNNWGDLYITETDMSDSMISLTRLIV